MQDTYPRPIEIEARPTWRLAWGLFWRIAILQTIIAVPIYAIIALANA